MAAVPTTAQPRPRAGAPAATREADPKAALDASRAIWAHLGDGLDAFGLAARLARLDAKTCYRLLATPRLVAKDKGHDAWRTPLMAAVERGHVAIARTCLSASAPASLVGVREQDGSATTAMTLAAVRGQPQMLNLLAEAYDDDADALFVLARHAPPHTIAWLRGRHLGPHLFDGVLAEACREGGSHAHALVDACTRQGGVDLRHAPALMVTALINGHFSLATRLLDLGAERQAIFHVDMDVWRPESDDDDVASGAAWPADPQAARRPVTLLGLVAASGCERARSARFAPSPCASPPQERHLCLPQNLRPLREAEVGPRLRLICRLAKDVPLAPPAHGHAWVLEALVAAGDSAAYAHLARHLSAWPASARSARALLAGVPISARPDLACLVERQAAALAHEERVQPSQSSWAAWWMGWRGAPAAPARATSRARRDVAELVGIIEAGGSGLPPEVAARLWVGPAAGAPRDF